MVTLSPPSLPHRRLATATVYNELFLVQAMLCCFCILTSKIRNFLNSVKKVCFSSVQFSRSVVSRSSRTRGLTCVSCLLRPTLTHCQSVSWFSRSVVSDSLRPRESQHARPPCSSPTPRVHSDSRPFESVMPSSHLILCRPLLLLPPIPPSISLFQ